MILAISLSICLISDRHAVFCHGAIKQETTAQWWLNAGPASQTPARRSATVSGPQTPDDWKPPKDWLYPHSVWSKAANVIPAGGIRDGSREGGMAGRCLIMDSSFGRGGGDYPPGALGETVMMPNLLWTFFIPSQQTGARPNLGRIWSAGAGRTKNEAGLLLARSLGWSLFWSFFSDTCHKSSSCAGNAGIIRRPAKLPA